MNGLDRITDRILAEAQERADRILADAEAERDRITADYTARAEQIRTTLSAEAEKAARGAKFSEKPESDIQFGTITYIFRLR